MVGIGNRFTVRHPRGAVKRTHALDPHLLGAAKHYFGLDLDRISELSDEEVGQLADRAREMKRLRDLLPILEKHFQMLIEGQVEYEQFLTGVQKEVEKGAKKIDKAILDTWLLSKGYQQHTQLMGQQAQNGLALLEANHGNAMTEHLLDFKSAMQISAYRHRLRVEGIQAKMPAAIERENLAEAERTEREQRRNLWLFGSQSRGGSLQKRGGLSGVWEYFTGGR